MSTNKQLTESELHQALSRFTRSETTYLHPSYPEYELSDRVHFLISQGFGWLIEDILADIRKQKPGRNDMLIFVWTHPLISVRDGDERPVFSKTLECEPKPFAYPLRLWFFQHTLLLPSEY